MVKQNIVRAAAAALVQRQSLVAVFFAGATGIGHYTLRALATTCAKNGGKGLRAYIVARKPERAAAAIAECRGIFPQGEYVSVQVADLSLLKDVDEVCAQIAELEGKRGDGRIDYLMMTQGGALFLPRKDTSEGLDSTMSLFYYSRMRAITNLLPLLLKSSLPATVVSVYAPGFEAKLFPEDLSLRDLSRYSYMQARSHMSFMHALFFESLAEQHRGKLRLCHVFPGLVDGPGFENPDYSWAMRFFFARILMPLLARFATEKPETVGERMVSLASPRFPARLADGEARESGEEVMVGSDGRAGSGAYSLGPEIELRVNKKAYEKLDKDELRKKVWNHTMGAFQVIESGKVFSE